MTGSQKEKTSRETSSCQILVVDDDATVAGLVKTTLSPLGQVRSSVSPARALTQIKTHPVDILVVDLQMPEMHGLEFLARAREVNPYAISIIMTGYPDEDSVRQARNLGAVDYLVKPFALENLIRVVKDLLKKKGLYSPSRSSRNYYEYRENIHMASNREYLTDVLRSTNGNVSRAAKNADLSRSQFYSLMKRFKIDPKKFR